MTPPLFDKVLVANRGEIACRIMRTLRAKGIASVAVYHHLDRQAPHVAMADEAVQLDGDSPTGAYLDAEQIVAIARRTGAQAIHPGYGFLSENAAFAELVAGAGIIFIGPDAATIRLMGDKITARDFAARHGVPIAPSVTQDGSLDAFLDKAAAIGFPLLIKAAAGGGGKGMKIARSKAELAENARLAASEAERYFKDGRIYAERLVDTPRHIEVQILGDGKGDAVHLFERECSLQRRYQKIVEEAPAPNLPADLRNQICTAAVALAKAARYKNAGTIEFILAPDGAFYFLEMNTRLQVEHPVTEAILHLDLVAEQLAIAAGQGLSLTQDRLAVDGHAIECRICAEEPEKDYRPATGRIGLLRLPAGDQTRFDSGIREGQSVSSAFDSMLAKLIVWGATRDEAVARMTAALDELALLGVPTNIDYLARIMTHPEFGAGRLDTGFLPRHAEQLLKTDLPEALETAVLAAAMLADGDFRRAVYELPEPYASIGQWRN
jgi:propionyl-CoA carboxylase alpha chain/3-methylcrotonyl-CoA carboxylase alpha subunit/acetyl-CoA/propionyl-CoA carboxylase biotin carboxyl carrier protein